MKEAVNKKGQIMKIYRLKPLSVCETNSYIVASEENNCVLIDAPADPDYILGEIESHGLTLKKIFLTHGHFDHIGAVADLVDRTGCEVYIHIMDKPKLTDDAGMLANLFRIRGHRNYTGKVNVFTEDDILKLDELEFDVLETPGHTSGSVCFICGMNMFSGDTLFSRSVGRTDMPDGSSNDYKYELEGVMKLFIPATLFTHVFSDSIDTEDDYVFAQKKDNADNVCLSVKVRYDGKTCEKEEFVHFESDMELSLSRLLFKAMSEITGIVPKWGVITGIRPVKRVNDMLSEGMNKAEIFKAMESRYLCSEEKCDIAYKTAITQKPVLDELEKDSFSLYVSVPFCPTRCSYCSFVSQSIEGCMKLIPEYVNKLCEEIVYTAKITEKLGLKLDTVYFGGGTPTTLTAAQLDRVMKVIANSFDMSTVREYTVEAGRPDTITEEKLKVLKANGCGRVSINPQTLNDRVLEAIGRKHTTAQFFDSFYLARKVGFDSINTDIIAGLPTDTVESFENTIDKLIELAPENITVHTLSIKRAARLNHSGDREVLKNPADKMVEYATKRLLESGYLPYYLYRQKNMLENLENIGWTKQGHESLYNIYIMEEVQTILAMGAGGSTKLVDKEGGRLERVFNYKFPLEYNKHFELMLKRKNEIEEFYAKEK